MIRYLVKTTSTATGKNVNFHGKNRIYIHGKYGWTFDADQAEEWYLRYTAGRCGYSSEKQAMRNYSYKHPQNDSMWKTTVEIIKVDVFESAR